MSKPADRPAGGPADGPAGGLLERLAALTPSGRAGYLEVLSDRPDATVVRAGEDVLKVHAPGTDERALRAQIAVAQTLGDVFLAPASLRIARCDGRLVTRWPYAPPLLPDDVELPWAAAATQLARLHAVDPDTIDGGQTVGRHLPEGGGPRRMLRAVALLRAGPPSAERDLVLDAFAALPLSVTSHARSDRLLHGDWHLGQVVRTGSGLRLIDVDELGRGDPVWDLARPAAWYALGLMPGTAWYSFLGTYLAAGGVALPAEEPWSVLDAPARAMVVQSAARAVEKDAGALRFDEADRALIGACQRIARATSGDRS